MTPHHLHATAAALSLEAALLILDATATVEARAIAAQEEARAEPLRSPTWGRRTALGGHGDPTGDAILTTSTTRRRNRYADVHHDVLEQLYGVARHLPSVNGFDPLYRIREAIPAMQPGTAATLTVLLVRLDERVRRELRISPQRQPLPGVACPACRHRLVYVLTAGPQDAWTVVCAADCRCVGLGCRCGQDGAVEGVAHIWPRAAVIGAVAGGQR